MVIIGQSLTTPETGWQRINDTDINITYTGGFVPYSLGSGNTYFWDNNTHRASIASSKIQFNFTGTKIRIINQMQSTHSNNITIKLDGVNYSFSEYILSGNPLMALVYEKLDLANKEHYVEIISNDAKYTEIDAIDIDTTGQIKSYNPNLNKFLIKQGTSYYSIKPEFYSQNNFNDLSLSGSQPNDTEYQTYGFDDIGVLTNTFNIGQVNSIVTTLGSGKLASFDIPTDFKTANNIKFN